MYLLVSLKDVATLNETYIVDFIKKMNMSAWCNNNKKKKERKEKQRQKNCNYWLTF